jgi:hypothetical protein
LKIRARFLNGFSQQWAWNFRIPSKQQSWLKGEQNLEITVGGHLFFFKFEKYNRQSMGLVCNKSGLQFGIPTKPFS